MGTPIDKSPCGDVCSSCWGSGKPFGVKCTPRYLKVVVSDVLKGSLWLPVHGEPPNGYFWLDQSEASSCRWEASPEGFSFSLVYGSFLTSFQVLSVLGFNAFSDFAAPCELDFVNELLSSSSVFYSGTAKVTFGFE